ncbi:hypothetical protein ACHAQA_005410 [Verticillium albo-atrum]
MTDLENAVYFLLDESARARPSKPQSRQHGHHKHHYDQIRDHLEHLERSTQLRILHELLCMRTPATDLPPHVLDIIDGILIGERANKVLTLADTIPPLASLSNAASTKIALWRGDITTLSNVSAIVNAANGQGLGCFQPSHRCIDNVIHAAAGPRLRDECYQTMTKRLADLAPGESIVTKGYCLPSQHVVHVVGPQLAPQSEPTANEKKQLAACYVSALEAVEALPTLDSGRKIVAFCCISTGLFSFPAAPAATIAVDTVDQWLGQHPGTTVTDIIFNTFTEVDERIYQKTLETLPEGWTPQRLPREILPTPEIECQSIETARDWLASADTILITVGAGFSAAAGLDYNSKSLFSRNFPAFKKRHGLSTLYSVFGFDGWSSEEDRWGYYFTHLSMVKNWPRSELYDGLLSWLRKSGAKAHIRTSNADGLFLAHDWPAENLSTPQGSYAVLQCLANCRPEATTPSEPLRLAAVPSLDGFSQQLTDSSKVPRCQYCQSKMFICVRAGSWFNEVPFEGGEENWKQFRSHVRRGAKQTVILELGVGMSTPGVLRWPNEDLVRKSGGRVKLVRLGMGPETGVDSDLEVVRLATSVNGDIAVAMKKLLS